MSGKVLAAFNHACAVPDMEAVEESLGLLEKVTEQPIRRFGGDRRRARRHLAWVRANRVG